MAALPSPLSDPSRVVGALTNAPTTEAGYAAAIKKYNDFAVSNSFPFYEDLTLAFLEGKDVEEGSIMACNFVVVLDYTCYCPFQKIKASHTLSLALVCSILVA